MLFTVITINLNNAGGLKKTIESVLAQERSLFEYIVIDGASTDGSVDVARSYGNGIDCLISEPDKGIYNAMNKGIALAKGEYVIFMNSGDKFSSSDVLSEVAATGLTADFMIGASRQQMRWIKYVEKPAKPTPYNMLFRTFCHQSTFSKLSVLKMLGGYDENIRYAADICLLLKASMSYGCSLKTLPIIVSDYDTNGVSSENLSSVREEKYNYFKIKHPAVLEDYVWAHRWLRLLPSNVLRVIKWRVSTLL